MIQCYNTYRGIYERRKRNFDRDIVQQKLIREAKRVIIGHVLILLLAAFVYGMMFLLLLMPSF